MQPNCFAHLTHEDLLQSNDRKSQKIFPYCKKIKLLFGIGHIAFRFQLTLDPLTKLILTLNTPE
jgi:hypothetical protein